MLESVSVAEMSPCHDPLCCEEISMHQHLLLATDGSELAQTAVAHGLDLAESHDSHSDETVACRAIWNDTYSVADRLLRKDECRERCRDSRVH
jgi:hypothetical protein